jgi:branched-chain amino acid transport system substrate-binding protein
MKTKVKVLVAVTLFVLLTSLLLVNCIKPTAPQNTLQIGVILPLTGPGAPFGISSKNALLLASDELNAIPNGPRFNLQIEDGMTDVKSSVSAFSRLHDSQNVRHFITSVSGVSLALASLADQRESLLFANANHPQITEGRKYVFRYSTIAQNEADAIHQFVSNPARGWGKLYVIATNDDYGRAYATALKEAQAQRITVNIVGTDFFDPRATNLHTLATKAIATNPDAIILVGFGRSLGLLIRQLRELGYVKPFITSLGLVATPDAITSAGEAIRGGYYVNFEYIKGGAAIDFRKMYRERYGEEPNPSSLIDYGTLHLIAIGVKAVGTDPKRLADFFKNAGTIQLPTGAVSLSAKGDIIPSVFVASIPASGEVDLWRE